MRAPPLRCSGDSHFLQAWDDMYRGRWAATSIRLEGHVMEMYSSTQATLLSFIFLVFPPSPSQKTKNQHILSNSGGPLPVFKWHMFLGHITKANVVKAVRDQLP
jgi:hypothetical protein